MINEPQLKLDGKRIPLEYDSKTKRYTAVVCIDTSENEASLSCRDRIHTAALHNSDATNVVQWGVAPAVYVGRLLAGGDVNHAQLLLLDRSETTLYLKSNNAACKVVINLETAATR